eukprot:gnl/Chilomastix_cuspidata/3035.p3 GENE.gnl/Chilomastix_cuspidata/3035~~gnl/Chilomastix_cuspidata/3035.p3  ORF type:complete len:144 (+),score=80.41 gnl/Chilomastix_cuspidata/3035:228-659(+)
MEPRAAPHTDWRAAAESARAVDCWAHATFFDDAGNVLASTETDPARVPTRDQLEMLSDALFDTRDRAVTAGIDLLGEHFDVYRWYDGRLIFGRKAGSVENDGAAVIREPERGFSVVFTYRYPVVAPLAVQAMRGFLRDELRAE